MMRAKIYVIIPKIFQNNLFKNHQIIKGYSSFFYFCYDPLVLLFVSLPDWANTVQNFYFVVESHLFLMHWWRLGSFCLYFKFLFTFHFLYCPYCLLFFLLFLNRPFSLLFLNRLFFRLFLNRSFFRLFLYHLFFLLSHSFFSLFRPFFFFLNNLFRENVLFCCILFLLLLFLVWCFFFRLN